jgi:hypothetical protein
VRIPELSSEAQPYAVRELGRRAGVREEQLEQWRIIPGHNEVAVMPLAGSEKRITFPLYGNTLAQNDRDEFVTARMEWMQPPSPALRESIPNFVVPFSSKAAPVSGPLFALCAPDEVRCSVDLLSSTLLTLARFEENDSSRRDEHGRFPAAASIAGREGFLQRPIVDEYGLALEQALLALVPRWEPAPRVLRVKLTHDVDAVGMPFWWRDTLEHVTKRRAPAAAVRDVAALVSTVEPAFLNSVRRIAGISIRHGFDSAVYWKASVNSPSPHDSGYDPRDPKIRRVIAWLSESGIEQGLHPGYLTFDNVEELQSEVTIIRQLLGDVPIGGRQHFLRWTPQTWKHWEACGLAYDSTLGYADQVGFRAGTCYPYQPWLLDENRAARLLEIPLIVMDGTLVDYMKLTPSGGFAAITEMLDRVRLVGGVFLLLWHNSTLRYPQYGNIYDRLSKAIVGCRHYDWQSDFTKIAATDERRVRIG